MRPTRLSPASSDPGPVPPPRSEAREADPETCVKLTLHYDGGGFRGWQLQPGQPTVQGALEDAVLRLTGERRRVLGSGRTDAGVHATGQVAAVTVPASWTAPRLRRALNALLPRSVWVEDASPAPRSFNPRFDATSRSYRYRVGVAEAAASPFRSRWCWPLLRRLDVDAAARAADRLIGARDFRSFAKADRSGRGHRCRVASARWSQWGDLGWTFEISADRFLHRMVRYLVGTMVDIALNRRDEADMALLLGGEPSAVTSPPAPARGLFLTHVAYPAAKTRSSAPRPTGPRSKAPREGSGP